MKIKLHLKVNVPGVVPPTIKIPSHQLLKWRYVKKIQMLPVFPLKKLKENVCMCIVFYNGRLPDIDE